MDLLLIKCRDLSSANYFIIFFLALSLSIEYLTISARRMTLRHCNKLYLSNNSLKY